MYQVQINKATFQNHINYDWWKYLVGILATIFIWSMVTTMSRPRTPADKKLDIYMVGDYMMQDAVDPISDNILQDFPELLEANIFNIALEGEMEYIGRQQLMVMVGSQTGDVYAFNEEDFETMAEQGAFIPLDQYIEEFQEIVPKEKLEEYKYKAIEQEGPHYYGVPMEEITLFENSGYDVSNKVIGVMAYSKNQEKAIQVIKWFLNDGNK